MMNTLRFRMASGLVVLLVLGVGVASAADPAAAPKAGAGVTNELDFGPQRPASDESGAKKAKGKKNRRVGKDDGSKKSDTSKTSATAAKADEQQKSAAPRAAVPAKKPSTSSKSSASKSAAATKPKAPVGGIQLAPIAAAGDAVIGNRNMTQCRVQSALPKSVAKRNPKVILTEKPAGKVLSLKIIEIDARSGGLLSGSKAMTIEGRLLDKGKTIGTFTARQKSRGSLTSCGILEKAIDEVASEIGVWLDKPAMNAKLGNDR